MNIRDERKHDKVTFDNIHFGSTFIKDGELCAKLNDEYNVGGTMYNCVRLCDMRLYSNGLYDMVEAVDCELVIKNNDVGLYNQNSKYV